MPGSDDLKKRAQWYREFAKLGTSYERTWRLQMAAYFDRLAEAQDARDRESEDLKHQN